MFEINADNILYTLWDTLRPDISSGFMPGERVQTASGLYHPIEPGLMTTLDLRLSHYAKTGDEFHASALVHTLFTGNTSVFVAISRSFQKWDHIPVEQYKNTSNHDSCWRSDGLRELSTLFFALTDEMNEQIKSAKINGLKPCEFNQFCTLGSLGSKPWEFVTVEHERIPEEYHKRRVLSVQPSTLKG
jgi:hypothetical protein